jgi:protease II
MQGYGAYGLNMKSDFSTVNLTAVEKDWVLAFAHVRGGGEKGFGWH